jgi:hypothetical protein
MPLFTEQTIYCSGCGRPYKCNFNTGWISSSARARVCSKECKDRVDLAYARCVVGKPDPQWVQLGRDPTGVGLVAAADPRATWSHLIGCRVRRRNDCELLGRLFELRLRDGLLRADLQTARGPVEFDPVYLEVETPSADLAAQMAADPEFVRRTEEGWRALDEGRGSSLADVKRRLGDE